MKTIGEKIRDARERKGLSQTALARRVGISQPSLVKIEDGRTKNPSKLIEIAAELDIPLIELRPELSTRLQNGESIKPSGVVHRQFNFPVYLLIQGRNGRTTMSKNPVELIERPSLLMDVKDSYGVRVSDGTMVPAYEVGDVVFIHPYMPPVPDTDVLLRRTEQDESEAVIRRMLNETATEWHVLQYSPRREARLPKSEWTQCDRIVGKYNRK